MQTLQVQAGGLAAHTGPNFERRAGRLGLQARPVGAPALANSLRAVYLLCQTRPFPKPHLSPSRSLTLCVRALLRP